MSVHDDVGGVRPTWAMIDEAVQHAEQAEAYANTVAERRSSSYPDARAARSAAEAFKRGARLMRMVEREEAG